MDFKTQYFQIWQQVWNLHKKYYNIRADDEAAWQMLNREQRFVQSLLLGIIAELEREARHGETAGTVTPTQS